MSARPPLRHPRLSLSTAPTPTPSATTSSRSAPQRRPSTAAPRRSRRTCSATCAARPHGRRRRQGTPGVAGVAGLQDRVRRAFSQRTSPIKAIALHYTAGPNITGWGDVDGLTGFSNNTANQVSWHFGDRPGRPLRLQRPDHAEGVDDLGPQLADRQPRDRRHRPRTRLRGPGDQEGRRGRRPDRADRAHPAVARRHRRPLQRHAPRDHHPLDGRPVLGRPHRHPAVRHLEGDRRRSSRCRVPSPSRRTRRWCVASTPGSGFPARSWRSVAARASGRCTVCAGATCCATTSPAARLRRASPTLSRTHVGTRRRRGC
jgi:hypothetical protein